MLTGNCELRRAARNSLSGKWGMSALTMLLYLILAGSLPNIPWIGFLFSIFLSVPLAWGLSVLFLGVFRGENVEFGKMFDGFKDYGRIWGTMILTSLYIFLWTLLLIIPGIIKSFSYAMVPYILKDEPELAYNAAIEKSMAMMRGRKMKLFLLELSFIGWGILAILTLGIGFFWLSPYMSVSVAAFYEDLKKEDCQCFAKDQICSEA